MGKENGNRGSDEGGRTQRGGEEGKQRERRNTHTKEEGNRERRNTKGWGGNKERERVE